MNYVMFHPDRKNDGNEYFRGTDPGFSRKVLLTSGMRTLVSATGPSFWGGKFVRSSARKSFPKEVYSSFVAGFCETFTCGTPSAHKKNTLRTCLCVLCCVFLEFLVSLHLFLVSRHPARPATVAVSWELVTSESRRFCDATSPKSRALFPTLFFPQIFSRQSEKR